MCLGKNSRRIKALEKEVRILNTKLLELTTFRTNFLWVPIYPLKRFSIVEVVKAIVKHLDISFEYVHGKSACWEIVEKVEESEEE